MQPLTVFACESQPVVLEGLRSVLERSGIVLVGTAYDLANAVDGVRESQPDVVLVDHTAGLKMVFQFIADARSVWPNCQVVLWVNDLAEIDCFRALQTGARGVLKKTLPLDSLIECVRSVAEGNVWIEGSVDQRISGMEHRPAPRLTPREKEIVQKVCAGLKNKDIAAALSITPGTVKVHLMHIFEKTGVKDRFELAVCGRKLLGLDHAEMVNRLEVAS